MTTLGLFRQHLLKSETNKEESFYVQVFAGPVTASVQVNVA